MDRIYEMALEMLEPVQEISVSFFLKHAAIKMNPFDKLNWQEFPIMNGNFEAHRKNILKVIDCCKTMKDVQYLKNDMSQAKGFFTKYKQQIQYTIDHPDDMGDMCIEIRKRMDKGLTIKKIEEHEKWLNDVYKPKLKEKENDIKSKMKG